MAKQLEITATYRGQGESGEAKATVPYVTGTYELPPVYPFGKNYYVGPDAGFCIDNVRVNAEEGKLIFGYAETICLDENGRAFWRDNDRFEDQYVEVRFEVKD